MVMLQGDRPASAADFLPPRLSLPSLRAAAGTCRGCHLYQHATQTVFGIGRSAARLMLVGEQPGNDEDLQGEPFVGPAGRVLDEGLARAGIAREDAYVTNVVKHFKWTAKGFRRMHSKPNRREIQACRPWLDSEAKVVKPEVVVCLGSTAAQALLRPDFKVTREHGVPLETPLARYAVATIHPSAILRQRTAENREREMEQFIADLRVVRGAAGQRSRRALTLSAAAGRRASGARPWPPPGGRAPSGSGCGRRG